MEKITIQKHEFLVLKNKIEFYKKLEKKIDSVMNANLDIDDWSEEVYLKLQTMEDELDDLEFNLPD